MLAPPWLDNRLLFARTALACFEDHAREGHLRSVLREANVMESDFFYDARGAQTHVLNPRGYSTSQTVVAVTSVSVGLTYTINQHVQLRVENAWYRHRDASRDFHGLQAGVVGSF